MYLLQKNPRILNNRKLFPGELAIAVGSTREGVTSKQLILSFKTLTKRFKES